MLNDVHFKFEFWFKIEKMGLFLVKGRQLKKCQFRAQTLNLYLCQSASECPNFLKNWEPTFDMSFEKKPFQVDLRKSIF
jgi:hypothetical protein